MTYRAQHPAMTPIEYRGYRIRTGEPQYGHQFAIAYTLIDGEGRMHFVKTIEEAKEEIDELWPQLYDWIKQP